MDALTRYFVFDQKSNFGFLVIVFYKNVPSHKRLPKLLSSMLTV